MTKENALVVIGGVNLPAGLDPALLEKIKKDMDGANLGGTEHMRLRPPVLKICYDKDGHLGEFVHTHDDNLHWQEFNCIVIGTVGRRSFWEGRFDSDNPAPPDCGSTDGKICDTGETPLRQGKPCIVYDSKGNPDPEKSCPKALWSENPKTGKNDVPPECGFYLQMLLWHEDGFAAQFTTSPTTLKHVNKYVASLKFNRKPSYLYWTHFKAITNKKGTSSWYEVVPTILKPIDPQKELGPIQAFLLSDLTDHLSDASDIVAEEAANIEAANSQYNDDYPGFDDESAPIEPEHISAEQAPEEVSITVQVTEPEKTSKPKTSKASQPKEQALFNEDADDSGFEDADCPF